MLATSPAPPPIRWLLIALVAATQLPALIALVGLGDAQFQSRRADVRSSMVRASTGMAMALQDRLLRTQTEMLALARQVPSDPARLGDFHALALSSLGQVGVDAMTLFSPPGTTVLSTRVPWGEPLPPRMGAPVTAAELARGSSFELVPGIVTRQPRVRIVVPVVQDSRIAYALGAGIEPRRFADFIAGRDLPREWIALIADREGRIIARQPGHAQFLGQRLAPELQQQIDERGGAGSQPGRVFESRSVTGEEVLTSVATSPLTGWTVAVSVPRSVLMAPVWRDVAWLGAHYLLAFAMLIAAALTIGSRIERSVARLARAAAALPQGRRIVPAPMDFAEAQQLANTLVGAQAEIEAGHGEVERVSREYDRRLLHEVESRQLETARELHDSIASSLAGASLLLASAIDEPTKPAARRMLERARAEVMKTAQQVRDIAHGMTPAGTEAGALVSSLSELAFTIGEIHGIECRLRVRGDFEDTPADVGTQLYRIVQEACANAIRHGDARTLRLTLVEHGGRARLTIRDDGQRVATSVKHGPNEGMGLRSMRARARAIDGRIEFRRGRPHGWCVRVCWGHRTDGIDPAGPHAPGNSSSSASPA